MRAAGAVSTCAAAAFLAVCLGGCAALPWGQGEPEPPRATAGAFVRTFDQLVLADASQLLDERMSERWYVGVPLDAQADDEPSAFDWSGWVVQPGAPSLELAGPRATQQGEVAAIMVRVPLAEVTHTVAFQPPGAVEACAVLVTLAPGELSLPMSFAADKLGRVQGLALPGATYRAASELTPTVYLSADFAACDALAGSPVSPLGELGTAFVAALARAVGDDLVTELPAALGLDLAFGWSGPLVADAVGTGFLRVALRGLESGAVRQGDAAMQLLYALTVEATAHPCMGSLELPEPRSEVPVSDLPAGSALHLTTLERIVEASWLAGLGCADHLGRVPVRSAAALTRSWPALGRIGADPEVSLEIWPAALPRILPDAGMQDGLVIETGRVRADLIVSYGDARWRGGSIELDLSVHGLLWVEPNGDVFFDPSAVEVNASALEGGLLPAPDDDPAHLAALVAPLVEALVLERPLAHLPPAMAPRTAGPAMVDGNFLVWQTRSEPTGMAR